MDNLIKCQFPSDDHHANVLAKHLYVKTECPFGNKEASVDDIICFLFDALGFNDEDLISVYV